MRPQPKFIASYSANEGKKENAEGVNRAKLAALVRKMIREKAGDTGTGEYELRKLFIKEERERLSIPESITGKI